MIKSRSYFDKACTMAPGRFVGIIDIWIIGGDEEGDVAGFDSNSPMRGAIRAFNEP